MNLENDFVLLSGSTTERVEEFINDVNTLLDLGFWWSDAVFTCMKIKGYDFVTNTREWDTFLDLCICNYTVSNREPIIERPLFLGEK